MENVRNDPKIRLCVNGPSDPPRFEVERMKEVAPWTHRWSMGGGFTFYIWGQEDAQGGEGES